MSPAEKSQYPYQPDGPVEYDEDLHVQCPSHTTERKLLAKIDLHVVPFLCILYLLAFLDRQVQIKGFPTAYDQ